MKIIKRLKILIFMLITSSITTLLLLNNVNYNPWFIAFLGALGGYGAYSAWHFQGDTEQNNNLKAK